MKQIIFVSITTLSLLLFTNCGGSSNKQTATNTINTDAKKNFEYFKDGYLAKNTNTTQCYKGLDGDSYQTQISVYPDTIFLSTSIYRYDGCGGDIIDYAYSSYRYDLGNESNDTKRVEITLTNVSYNDEEYYKIEEVISNYIFGIVINSNPYYTSIVTSGDIRNEKLRIGFARASIRNDGSSPEKRADDVSMFINRELFFIEN